MVNNFFIFCVISIESDQICLPVSLQLCNRTGKSKFRSSAVLRSLDTGYPPQIPLRMILQISLRKDNGCSANRETLLLRRCQSSNK